MASPSVLTVDGSRRNVQSVRGRHSDVVTCADHFEGRAATTHREILVDHDVGILVAWYAEALKAKPISTVQLWAGCPDPFLGRPVHWKGEGKRQDLPIRASFLDRAIEAPPQPFHASSIAQDVDHALGKTFDWRVVRAEREIEQLVLANVRDGASGERVAQGFRKLECPCIGDQGVERGDRRKTRCSARRNRQGPRMDRGHSAALPPSLRSPNMKPRANGTSACSLPSPFCRPASLPQSSMAQRLRILRSQVSPKP
jgi:hypothetical protein